MWLKTRSMIFAFSEEVKQELHWLHPWDSVVMSGVVVGSGVEMWSRGGWTTYAVSATRFSSE